MVKFSFASQSFMHALARSCVYVCVCSETYKVFRINNLYFLHHVFISQPHLLFARAFVKKISSFSSIFMAYFSPLLTYTSAHTQTRSLGAFHLYLHHCFVFSFEFGDVHRHKNRQTNTHKDHVSVGRSINARTLVSHKITLSRSFARSSVSFSRPRLLEPRNSIFCAERQIIILNTRMAFLGGVFCYCFSFVWLVFVLFFFGWIVTTRCVVLTIEHVCEFDARSDIM